MQLHEFISTDGIRLETILLAFSILLRKEESNYKYPTCLNRNEYVWIIGNNIYLRLKYLNNPTEFNMTELKRLTGIDVIRSVPGDRPNCIILKRRRFMKRLAEIVQIEMSMVIVNFSLFVEVLSLQPAGHLKQNLQKVFVVRRILK